MKVRNSRSRISLGHMEHRSRVLANSYAVHVASSALLAVLCFLSAGYSSSAQTRAKPAKSRSRAGRVQTGLDVLEGEKFAPLRGKHIGLITNHTGFDALGRSNIDLLARAAGLQLVALFSPEHGRAGRNNEKVSSSKDPTTGLPVYSLYGETRRPTDEML